MDEYRSLSVQLAEHVMCGLRKMRSSNPDLQKKQEYEFRHILL